MAPSAPGEGPPRVSRTEPSSARSRTYSPPSDQPPHPAKRPRTAGNTPNADSEPAFLDDDGPAIYSQLAASIADQHHGKAAVAGEIEDESPEKNPISSREPGGEDDDTASEGEDEDDSTISDIYPEGEEDDDSTINDIYPASQQEDAADLMSPSQQQSDDVMDVDEEEVSGEDKNDSQTSILSRCYYEDLRSDLCVDIENLLGTYVPPEFAPPKCKDVESHLGQATPFSRTNSRDVRHTLRKWLNEKRSTRSPSYFCRRFDGTYPPDRFSSHNLIGRDLALVKTFMGFVEEIPLEIFLVVLERYGDRENDSQDLFGRRVVDIHGRVLATHVPLQNFVPPDLHTPNNIGGPFDTLSEAVSCSCPIPLPLPCADMLYHIGSAVYSTGQCYGVLHGSDTRPPCSFTCCPRVLHRKEIGCCLWSKSSFLGPGR